MTDEPEPTTERTVKVTKGVPRFKLWMARMKRENKAAKIEQYYQLVAERAAAENKPVLWCREQVITELGALKLRAERDLADAYANSSEADFEQRVEAEVQKRVRKAVGEIKTGESWEYAIRKLPDKPVDSRLELGWIANHPAMTRKSRMEDGERVLLTSGDVKDAPCRSAAIKLQNWADDPKKFFEAHAQLLIKKGNVVSDDKDADLVVDDGIDELERAHKALTNGGGD